MGFLSILYWIFIGPLQLLFEFVFSLSYNATKNPALSVVILSIVMNLLALPLYRRANALQKEEKEKMNSLQDGMDHIKKTFKGDERLLVLQTFYRQNDYSPLHVFRGSISLFLQIPFFMAAYRMLSSLTLFNGKALGPISDLGSPDALLVIGGLTVNVLPILMTVINIISSSIYTKGAGIKEKLQLYGVAAVFLVLLYNSPAGLVFYWTCNNLFSLIKNLIPAGAKKKGQENKTSRLKGAGKKVFILCGIYDSILLGILIPSYVIKASTAEFVNMYHSENPALFLIYSLALAVGTFLVWEGVFYYVSGEKGKEVMNVAAFISSLIFTVDFFLFGREYGILRSSLTYGYADMDYRQFVVVGLAVTLAICLAGIAVKRYIWKSVPYLMTAAVATILIMSSVNIGGIDSEYKALSYLKDQQDYASISLSGTGKNVIVIMLDRAAGFLEPSCFYEMPELAQKFDGFTFYPNTLSFGAHTNTAAPALYGGYEYTPYAMNGRTDMTIPEKHDESLKVMPVLFLENGFDVTVCDPSYAGYKYIPDLSVYEDYPGIEAYVTNGRYDSFMDEEYEESSSLLKRNFFCYAFFRVMPPFLHELLYDNGLYNNPDFYNRYRFIPIATARGNQAKGYLTDYLRSASVLEALPSMTSVGDGNGTFLMMVNYTAHSTAILSEPEYGAQFYVDNTVYDEEHADRFTDVPMPLEVTTYDQIGTYQTNMSSYILLGQWFDYLREIGVYDNTRIIIVADHGCDLKVIPGLQSGSFNAEYFNPLLMVKDFDATGYSVSYDFMTNADTPSLAFAGLIDDPVNPFTGNPISMLPKTEDPLYVSDSHSFDILYNDGITFDEGDWYLCSGAPLEMSSWEYAGTW